MIEFGIVIAVIAVLMAITVSAGGFLRVAKGNRTAKDMYSLLSIGQTVARRYVRAEFVGASGRVMYRLCNGLTSCGGLLPSAPNLPAMGPSCFDLGGGSAGTGMVDSRFKAIMGRDTARNGYDNPYVMCLYNERIDVQSCVDSSDVVDNASFRALSDCTMPCVQPGFVCKALSGSLLPGRSQRLRLSYPDGFYAPGSGAWP